MLGVCRLAPLPAVSVADASQKLLDAKSVIREGRDPALEARMAKARIGAPGTLRELIANISSGGMARWRRKHSS